MPWNPLDDLSLVQREQLDRFADELTRVNRRINLISPSDISHLAERHMIHSLAIAFRGFPDGATVVDFGAGGGLPTIPLAIRFPDVRFIAIDAVRKKTEAIRTFARRLGLENVDVWHGRAEAWEGRAHYAVSRATATLSDLWSWFDRVLEPLPFNEESHWPPGLITLKGGDLTSEIAALASAASSLQIDEIDLSLLERDYFIGKRIVAVREG